MKYFHLALGYLLSVWSKLHTILANQHISTLHKVYIPLLVYSLQFSERNENLNYQLRMEDNVVVFEKYLGHLRLKKSEEIKFLHKSKQEYQISFLVREEIKNLSDCVFSQKHP